MTYLRFGIRDLLWAIVVVGLSLGYWAERREATYHRSRADWWNREVSKRQPLFDAKAVRHLQFDEQNREVREKFNWGSITVNR